MFRVIRRLEDIGPDERGGAICIGNFDGVHAGHRVLFRRAVELGKLYGWTPSVLTFDPHPTKVVAPARAPRLLSSIAQRVELMHAEAIEQVFVLVFDRQFSQMSAEDFVRHVLAEGLGARAVLVGDNFRFGKGQAGDLALLERLGSELGFQVETAGAIRVRSRFVSSTEIRRLVESGNVSMACRLLERPFWLEGQVVRGAGIGAKQTVPTLNLETESEVLPAHGVYVTQTRDLDSGRMWPSITNVGTRPTFDGNSVSIETYLLSELGGDSPSHIRVKFRRRVRDERRFESPEALKAQILRDVSRAQTYFRRLEAFACR